LDHGVVVVCAGGGGIPVVVDSGGARHGVEAVVDKDLASALLARQLGADLLLLLTDVAAVELDWGTANARPLGTVTSTELATYSFAAGSMAPKVEAASSFVRSTGKRAVIGALADAALLVEGAAGTTVVPDPS
jgi:carbamate kinase